STAATSPADARTRGARSRPISARRWSSAAGCPVRAGSSTGSARCSSATTTAASSATPAGSAPASARRPRPSWRSGGRRCDAPGRSPAGPTAPAAPDGPLAPAPHPLCNRLLRDLGHVADHDSYLFAKLRAAGFVVIAKTNAPELGLLPTAEPLAYPPARNPWDT